MTMLERRIMGLYIGQSQKRFRKVKIFIYDYTSDVDLHVDFDISFQVVKGEDYEV